MKKKFYLLISLLFALQFSVAQRDSPESPLIDLTIVLKVQDTGEPVNGVTLKITGSDSSQRIFTTDITGTMRFIYNENTGFLKSGNSYSVEATGAGAKFFGVEDSFSTMQIIENTRLIREYGILKMCSVGHPKTIPSLNIKGILTEIDSASQDSLDYLYALMIENPSMVVSITSLFEFEMDITPFWRRSEAVRARLVEMGIPKERLIVKIATYSEQTDLAIQNRQKGNVIFGIESFGYVPAVTFSPPDSAQNEPALILRITDMEEETPVANARGYVIRNNTDTITFTSNENGEVTINQSTHAGFLQENAVYEIYVMGILREYSSYLTMFETGSFSQKKKLIWKIELENSSHTGEPPPIVFEKKSCELDSANREVLTYFYDLLSENSTILVEVAGAVDRETKEKLAWKRVEVIQKELILMGIDPARIQTNVYLRPSVPVEKTEDPAFLLQTTAFSDIRFRIVSFGYVPE
ncbi:MAG: hypothetical protein HYZ14_04395 [Bacteroidetes bacterium]|nr:hypothetical protein [Bacteroidota bacterium]